ncbi:MAG: pentapeptide repeat-containing protein [Verrucomicrobiaceae bacterium]|nr:pentapeptide repeat-containing protein [Verrucomicrobiaceae bacterium]
MPVDAITILHISDMQFGKYHRYSQAHPGTPPNEYDTLSQRLILDLDHLMGKTTAKIKAPIAKPDLIICTGDLAEWGLAKEFTQAFDFLGKVAEHLGLSRDRVIVIPGNHDINRKQCESYFIECEAEGEIPVFPWFPKWKQFKAAFDAFYADSSGITFTPAEPWTLFPIHELTLVVAGLNSTIDEGHDAAVEALADPGHHGFCGEPQLRWFEGRLSAPEFAGWIRIAAVHHNISRGCRSDNENLRDEDFMQSILAPHLDLVLHGHTHQAKDALIKPDVPVFSTGSASLVTRGADAIPTDVPNQYQIITLRQDSITRHCRSYNGAATPPKWIGDNSLSLDGSEWIITDRADFGSAHAIFNPSVDDGGFEGIESTHHVSSREFARIISREFSSEISAADLFRENIVRLTELRHERARVEPLHWQHEDMRCLSVSFTTESGIHTCRPLATCLQCPTTEELDAFHAYIVRQYRASEPRLMADCIFGDGAEIPTAVQAHADRLGIRLQRIAQYRGLLDLTDFIQGQTARVEEIQKRAAYRPDWYVDQRMNFEAGPIKDTTADALAEVAGWMQQPGPAFALILGEPGTGKTFLMLELARRLAAVPCMRPILVELRGMEKAKTVAAMLGAQFADHKQPSDPKKLNHMVREGAVTLLFDGFDELALRVGYMRAADHLNEIIAAAQGEAPHIVVTSRTSHFESDKQVRNKLAEALQAGVQGLHYCHLLPFESPQIEAFLQKRFPSEAEDWMRLLRDVEDLIDLSRIPRMLAFITEVPRETLEQARKPGSGTVSAGDVYRLVVEGQWLPFEHRRMNQPGSAELFTVPQMLDAVQHLAQALWRTTDRFISLSELGDHTQRILEKFAPDKVGQEMHATHQLGSGTLLMRDADGRFTFIHQSVLEWLVADQAARELLEHGDTKKLDEGEMPSLMADFFIDLAGQAHAGQWAAQLTSSNTSADIRQYAKSNGTLLLKRLKDRYGTVIQSHAVKNLAGADLSGRVLLGEDFQHARMERVKLYEANLSAANLYAAHLLEADLRHSDLFRANLQMADLTRADLTGANLSHADLRGADLTEADFTRATLIGADLRGAVLTGSQWHLARLAGAVLDQTDSPSMVGVGQVRLSTVHTLSFASAVSRIHSVAWNTRFGLIAAGHENGSIVIWDASSFRILRVLQGHQGWVRGLAFCLDGHFLASGGDDKTIRIWDLYKQKFKLLVGHDAAITCLAVSPGGGQLVSGSKDKTVRIWDIQNGSCLHILKRHLKAVTSVAFSPQHALIASGSNDQYIRLWSSANGQYLRGIKDHTEPVTGVAFTHDGSVLVSTSSDNTFRQWRMPSGALISKFKGHTNAVSCVSSAPNSSLFATGSFDKTIRMWNSTDGALVSSMPEKGQIRALCFGADNQLASGGDEGCLGVWDCFQFTKTHSLRTYQNAAFCASWFSGGARIVAGFADGLLRIWNLAKGDIVQTLDGHQDAIYCLACSTNGRCLVTGSSDGSINLRNADSLKIEAVLNGHSGRIRCVTFDPLDKVIVSGSDDCTIRIWRIENGEEIGVLAAHRRIVWGVAYCPKSTQIASASGDTTIGLWDAHSGRSKHFLTGHSGSVYCVAFSSDGRWLASGSEDNSVRIWHAQLGSENARLIGHTAAVWSVAFSPDCSLLASGSSDNTIRIWDTNSCRQNRILLGHSDSVVSISFWKGKSDGALLLLSYSAEGTVRIWDADNENCMDILLAHGDSYAALRPDGRYRAVGNMRDYLWHVSGLVRYELGELDEVDPHLKLADDEPLIPPVYFGRQ